MSVHWGNTNPFTSSDSFQSSTSSSGSECTLTPAASAFSAMLSAFVGSVINGLTSGWLVAFATGWISWLAIFRVLMGGLYMLYRSLTNSWGPGKNEDTPAMSQGGDPSSHLMAHYNNYNTSYPGGWEMPPQYTGRPVPKRGYFTALWPPAAVVRALDQHPTGPGGGGAKNPITKTWTDLNRDVTILGWFSWVYTALWAPVSQIIWVAANSSRDDIGTTKIVKGLTVAVTALPLCIDCRVRYADKLKWGGHIFNLVTSLSCLLQGALCAVLLVQGVIDASSRSFGFPLPIVAIYPVLALVWMIMSFAILPMRDGGRKRASQAHWAGYFIDIGVGAFAGLFLAAPAFALYFNAQFDRQVAGSQSTGMSDLEAYLRCETQGWKWFAAVAP